MRPLFQQIKQHNARETEKANHWRSLSIIIIDSHAENTN